MSITRFVDRASREPPNAAAEATAWQSFDSAASAQEFYAAWLGVLCGQVDRVRGAVLVVRTAAGNAYAPAAAWPDPARDMVYLAPVAQRAFAERHGVVDPAPGPAGDGTTHGARIAHPVLVQGVLLAAIALDLEPRALPELEHALRQVRWGAAWIADYGSQRELESRKAALDRMSLAADLVATASQQPRFRASAMAVANQISGALDCDRVSVGVDRDGNARVEAISHTADFDPKTALARFIADAMDETLDRGAPVAWPAQDDDAFAAGAHAALVRETGGQCVLSVPLSAGGHDWGVLLLERQRGPAFDAATVELVRAAGLLLGPVLRLQRENDRGAVKRARDGFQDWLASFAGPQHPGRKLLAGAAVLAALFALFATGEHRVSARTVIEGEVQRAIVAPFDGYVAESTVRAGDVVKAGQVMVRLDDRDLRLEQSKWTAEREQYLRKHRQALASHERAGANVLAAQVNQAEAQLQLVDEKLARAAAAAPFDGVVVSGDLSQLLGSPVEQGKVLFEVAPLDAYRVILKVDDRDIAYVKPGQTGELVLSGLPSERMRFTVARIAPVSVAEEGHNYFRAEARLERATERLRPGMQGVSKVEAGEERLAWIWTRRLVDWVRLALWTWMP